MNKADAKWAILMGKWEPAHCGIKQMNPGIVAFKKNKEGTLFLGPGRIIDSQAIVAFYDTDGLYCGAVELLQETPGDARVPAYSLLCLSYTLQDAKPRGFKAAWLYSPFNEDFLEFQRKPRGVEKQCTFTYRFVYHLDGEYLNQHSSVWIPSE